jgi:non-specific serine/threonine protein kinase
MIELIRQNRLRVAAGAGPLAGVCFVLALGGQTEAYGVQLSGLEEPWTRWLLAGVGAACAVFAVLLLAKVWPRDVPPTPPDPPFDGVPYIDRPERELLERSVAGQRVSVLIGPSGAGKSRLVRELVRSRSDRTDDDRPWYFNLRDDKEPDVVNHLVRATQSSQSQTADGLAILRTWIGERAMLLVLDNCDGALSGVATLVEQLTAGCPRVRFVLTSQEDPGVVGGPLEVRGLDVPPVGTTDPREVARYPAVQLLLALAGPSLLTTGSPAAVTSVCHRLDGLPIALKLAADELNHQNVQELDRDLAEMSPASAPLRGLLDLTDQRLDESERFLFRRLSVFSGPFTEDDVVAVAWPDKPDPEVRRTFRALVDRRLVIMVRNDDPLTPVPRDVAWFRLLGPFRRYAHDRLVDTQGDDSWQALRQRHATAALGWVEQAEPELTSRHRSGALLRLGAHSQDIDAALEWGSSCDAEIVARLSSRLFWYWSLRGELQQGERWLARALQARPAQRDVVTARLLYGRGGIAFLQGELATAVEELGDSARVLAAHPDEVRIRGLALLLLGKAKLEQGSLDESRQHGAQAVRILDASGEDWALALALNDHADRLAATGDWTAALEHYNRGLSLWVGLPDEWGESLTRSNLAARVWRAGIRTPEAHAEAREHIQRALEIQQAGSDVWGTAWSHRSLGELLLCEDDPGHAREEFDESLVLHHRIGRLQLVADCVSGLGRAAAESGDAAGAAALLAGAERLRQLLRVVQWPVEARLHETAVEGLRSRLSPTELTEAMAAGRATVTPSSNGRVQVERLVQVARESAAAHAG